MPRAASTASLAALSCCVLVIVCGRKTSKQPFPPKSLCGAGEGCDERLKTSRNVAFGTCTQQLASFFFLVIVSGCHGTIEREYKGAFNTPKLTSFFGRVGDEGFNAFLKKNHREEQGKFSSFLAPSLKKAWTVDL